MHWLDLAIVVVVGALALSAWRMGFLRGGVVLASIAVGVVLAGRFHERALIDLAITESPGAEMRAGAFLFILFAAIAAGAVAGHLLKSTASLLMLGWADRSAGAVFGFLFGVLLVQAVIAIVVLAPFASAREAVGESVIGSAMLENAPLVRALLPEEFDTAIREFRLELGDVEGLVDRS